MKKVVIVDYGLGNLYSIRQACIHVGYNPVVSGDPAVIAGAESLILPGVGAFGVAMNSLRQSGIISVLNGYVQSGKPIMGICLGMQLLFDQSEEFGVHTGLGYIPGRIVRFPPSHESKQLRVPNIGWCRLYEENISWTNTPLADIDKQKNHMYFVHSYYTITDQQYILASSDYNGFSFTSAVCRDNIWGFQFHPEKSSGEGLTIYQNFLKL